MATNKQKGEDRKSAPTSKRVSLDSKDIAEQIRGGVGNQLTGELLKYFTSANVDAKLSFKGRGHVLLAKGQAVYLADAFGEDENGMSVAGCAIQVESLRIPWFKDGLCKALHCSDESKLFQTLLENELFIVGNGTMYIKLMPVKVLEDKAASDFLKAKIAVDIDAESFSRYMVSKLSKGIPQGLEVRGADDPAIYPATSDGLRSMIKEDSGFKAAAGTVKAFAKEFIEEATKDPSAMRKKIYDLIDSMAI